MLQVENIYFEVGIMFVVCCELNLFFDCEKLVFDF